MKKKLLALTVGLCMLLTIFPMSAFATESPAECSQKAIEDILAEINAEYGTNIHILTSNKNQQYGISAPSIPTLTVSELVELESELRYIAEYEIPEFERTTQEAMQTITNIGISPCAEIETLDTTVASYNYDPLFVIKAIDYAVAAAEAYITQDHYGNTVWGSVVDKFCITDRTQSRWFYAANPTVSRIDGGRTLYWVGTGDYCSTINGVQYYLYSGTQYAEMYVGNYITQ